MNRLVFQRLAFVLFVGLSMLNQGRLAGEDVIPHHQDKPPGPALSPLEAVKKMTVPDGFSVEIVAAEPDIVNPIAMTIDEQGRFWITESLEYPRNAPGPGQDRVKVLTDTNGDGRADKFTLFLDGLNIPSGIAVGFGGVWIVNSPDLLFVPDANRDAVPDGPPQVVVTGFGRRDTHELANSLTWGPDGWLYGLNGIFNPAEVRYTESNPNYRPDHPGFDFNAAMFRIHPRTLEFQVFARGTSNPWGIAFNNDGEAFVSACVIDHLWHITETGYYRRQAGAYPPFTWPIESIVDYKHQKAAYCGIHYFDSDAYPEKYRRRLYMGNIHGNCINVDRLDRDGATYQGHGEADFLSANDAWFMPVVQKTGPDGSLYILDWYDRYHCYQDARRDPKGIDRLKGRLYRVRYQETPRKWGFDLGRLESDELVALLGSGNDYVRTTAQRLLQEQSSPDARLALLELVGDRDKSLVHRRHAAFALAGMTDETADREWRRRIGEALRKSEDPTLKGWAIRQEMNDRLLRDRMAGSLKERGHAYSDAELPPQQRVHAVIALAKLPTSSPVVMEGLLHHLSRAADDPLIPHIVWRSLHPRLEEQGGELIRLLQSERYLDGLVAAGLIPRVVDRLLSRRDPDFTSVVSLLELARGMKNRRAIVGEILGAISERVQTRQISGEALAELKQLISPDLRELVARGLPAEANERGLYQDAVFLLTSLKDEAGLGPARSMFAAEELPTAIRLAALKAVIAAGDSGVLAHVADLLAEPEDSTVEFRADVLASLAALNDETVAEVVLEHFDSLEAELQPRVAELLTQRLPWAKTLLAAIGNKQVPAGLLNLNQVQRLNERADKELKALVTKYWGTVRSVRDPARVQVISEVKQFLRSEPGDAIKGTLVFKKVCGQCHKIYGEGVEVGPDITRNGRSSFDQLLSNVFDPSLVIGAAYQSRTVITTDGRILTGLPVEETDQRIVLTVQGGKREIIPRGEIELFKVNKLSMMPEQLEKQLKPDELADLFAYLTLDRPPEDPAARQLPGVRLVTARDTVKPSEFAGIIQEVAPGFNASSSGERGVGLVPDHLGRLAVRTHPLNRTTPCVLYGEFDLPAGKKSTLRVTVSHDPRGDWTLIAKVNGQPQIKGQVIGKDTTTDGWVTHVVDLSRFAGTRVRIELLNQPSDWSWEFGYWGSVQIRSE
jgi:putative membrane-bound dehydrogenase-like protein